MIKKILFSLLAVFTSVFVFGQEITLTTTATKDAWSPVSVTKSGAVLSWEATNAVIGTVSPVSQVGSDPTFDFSGNDGSIINITVTSSDGLTGLTQLDFGDDADSPSLMFIKSLDLTNATALTFLNVRYNQLVSLDLSQNTVLNDFIFRGRREQLTSGTVDISNNTLLTRIWGDGTALTSMNVSSNPLLDDVRLYSNRLTSDVLDQIVIDLDNHGLTDGNLQISGNPEDLTSNALISYTNLINKNWFIDVPPPAAATGPEIDILGGTPLISIIGDGTNTPSATDDTDFGSAVLGNTISKTFTIQNSGDADLNLTDPSPFVSITGIDAADFNVSVVPTTPVTPLGSTTFEITFDASIVGVKAAILTIANNDVDETSYTFNIQAEAAALVSGPEINITGNGQSIPSGNTPIVSDNTDFGQVAMGSPVMHTFTIENLGDSNLTISYFFTSGTYFNFDPSGGGGIVLGSGLSTTIDVIFDPLSTGVQTGTITIGSDDPDEGTYIVNLTAEGITASAGDIDVQGGTPPISIANGDLSPDIADGTDFGQVSINTSKVNKYTIINNDPNDNLTISDINFVIGSDVEFAMDNLPAFPAVIAPGGNLTFDVVFFPTANVVSNAIVNIDNTDDNPYQFALTGQGADIVVGGNIMITQYYSGFSGTDNWVEIKNISGAPIAAGTYFLAMYDQDAIPGIASQVPTEQEPIPAMTTDQVLLFRNSVATIPSSGHIGGATQITTPVCNFDGDDVILISTTADNTCYGNRQDIIGHVTLPVVSWGVDVTFIKGGCATELPHAEFVKSDWIEIFPLTDVDGADPNTNLALGTQVVGSTEFDGISWSNLVPDRSRSVIFRQSFNHADQTIFACNLTVNDGANVFFNSSSTSVNSIVVYGDLVLEGSGSLTIGDTESLVTLDANASLGNITKIERSETLYNLHDNTYWCSPVQGSQMQSIFANVNPDRIFEYRPGAINPIYDIPGYENYIHWFNKPTGSMTTGFGYAAEGPVAPVDADDFYITPFGHMLNFFGVPNNGQISINVYYKGSPDVGDDNDNFNLIGNPYPSAVDIQSFLINNPAVNEIALWTHANPISSGGSGDFTDADYVYYNIIGSTTPGVTQNIGSGQGFMTRTVTSGNINFFNNFKMIDANDQFFKSENSKKGSVNKEIEKDRIWLKLSDSQRSKSNILIAFLDEATDGIDNYYDSYGLNSEKSINLYSKISESDSKFLIQGLGTFSEDKRVGLGIENKNAGILKISIAGIEGALKDADIFLVDNLLGITHNLNNSDYQFEQTTTGESSNRFTLQFAGAALGIDNFEKDNDFSIANTIDGFNIHASKVVTKVKVYDMLGRMLVQTNPNKQSFNLKVDNIKAGTVLVIESTLDNGAILSKKAIKY